MRLNNDYPPRLGTHLHPSSRHGSASSILDDLRRGWLFAMACWLMYIPLANIIVLYVLAFSDWKTKYTDHRIAAFPSSCITRSYRVPGAPGLTYFL